MTDGWQIKDKDKVLKMARHIVKVRAVTKQISIAEALNELVLAGAGALKSDVSPELDATLEALGQEVNDAISGEWGTNGKARRK